jgi:hypothetical protein
MDGTQSVGSVSSISAEMDIGAVLDSYANYVVCPAEIERNSKVYLHHQVHPLSPSLVSSYRRLSHSSFGDVVPRFGGCTFDVVCTNSSWFAPRLARLQIAKHWAFFFARASNADAPKEELYKFAGFLFKLIYRYATSLSCGGVRACVRRVSCVCGVCQRE